MTESAATPSSPCIKVCVVDPLSGLCIGCGRTVAEISLWPEMGAAQRSKILALLPQRMSEIGSRAMRGGRVGGRAGRAASGR